MKKEKGQWNPLDHGMDGTPDFYDIGAGDDHGGMGEFDNNLPPDKDFTKSVDESYSTEVFHDINDYPLTVNPKDLKKMERKLNRMDTTNDVSFTITEDEILKLKERENLIMSIIDEHPEFYAYINEYVMYIIAEEALEHDDPKKFATDEMEKEYLYKIDPVNSFDPMADPFLKLSTKNTRNFDKELNGLFDESFRDCLNGKKPKKEKKVKKLTKVKKSH